MNNWYIKGNYILFGNFLERDGKIMYQFYKKEEGELLLSILNNWFNEEYNKFIKK